MARDGRRRARGNGQTLWVNGNAMRDIEKARQGIKARKGMMSSENESRETSAKDGI